MNPRKLLQALGHQAEKDYDPIVYDSRYYHSKYNCGSELDISRRRRVFCGFHNRIKICECGWEKGRHYEYEQ